MNRLKSVLCALLALWLAAMLAGCENVKSGSEPNSELSSSSLESSESSLAGSPEPSAAEESGSKQEPASAEPESAPEDGEGSADSEGGFDALFDANPIDAKLQEDLGFAANGNAILNAYNDNSRYWNVMVSLSFEAALDQLDDQAQLRKEQEKWEASLEDELNAIQEENDGSADGIITAARKTGEKYRERAKALCRAYFDGAGKLPDFEKALNVEPVG